MTRRSATVLVLPRPPAPPAEDGGPADASVPAPVAALAPYGGHRLQPAHYEPARVPAEVARFAGRPDMLPAGSPGKVGLLELGFGLTGRGTELVHHYQKSPLQIMHPLYYDERRPDLPYTYLMSTGGGVLQGDRLRTDLAFGAGTSAHVTTSAYTKVLRMEQDYAVAQVNLDVADGAYVEYVPDPVLLFTDARLYQRTRATVAPGATLVLADTVVAGRLARGERHRYAALAADLEVDRPDGSPVAVDRVRLVPDGGSPGGPAVLGGRDVLGTLCVLTPLAPAAELRDLLRDAVAPASGSGSGVLAGVSTLPGDAGAWVRLVGDRTADVVRATDLAWRAVRQHLTGVPAPAIRKT
ncbi:urease accessory protein UreD [Cellulomonas hominis]|uniref:Urease accessory protein UreD n=1 Tax=Cellulomonas hominis TaxID=156981 RepID=A0A7Z8NQI3_9CELL|nr:urease accessory protein UreD [Cellulomonas hominis]TKR23567.1 urease accessory protein UreD [Cellulomonas hominis]